MVSSVYKLYRGENAYFLIYFFTIHCDIAKPELRNKIRCSMIRNQVFQSKIRWILLKNQAIKTAISKMNVNKNTRNKEITLFKAYGNEGVFWTK